MEFVHNRSSWEVMGIKKGSLPLILSTDPRTGEEYEAPMTMNGIEIDPRDPGVIRRISALKMFPTSVMSESLDTIKQAFETYINDENHPIRKTAEDSKFKALERVQRAYIMLQNYLLLDKCKI